MRLLPIAFACLSLAAQDSPVPLPRRGGGTGERAGGVRVNPKDGLKYLWILAGSFTMGCSAGDRECRPDERPTHEVVISKGFWLGQMAVTQAAYRRVTGSNPSNS